MKPINEERELLAGRFVHKTCLAGLRHKQQEIEEKIERIKKAKNLDKDELRKLCAIRDNIANALQNAR